MSVLDTEADAETSLFDALRELSLDCDESAPIYVTQSDIHHWTSTRKDLTVSEPKRQTGAFPYHLQLITTPRDAQARVFFEKVADLRARGESTSSLAVPQHNPVRRPPYANAHSASRDVVSLFQLTDDGSLDHVGLYVESLVTIQWIRSGPSAQRSHLSPLTKDKLDSEEARETPDIVDSGYGTKRAEACRLGCDVQDNPTVSTLKPPPGKTALPDKHVGGGRTKESDPDNRKVAKHGIRKAGASGGGCDRQKAPAPPGVNSSPLECLLCPKTWTYRTPMSQHYRRVHKETLSRPFYCPACPEQDYLVDGWNEWVLHIASRHGSHNAPQTRPMTQSRKDLLACLLCHKEFVSLGGLSKHTARYHASHFEEPKLCPACCGSKDEAPVISSLSEWCSHVELSHGGAECAPSVGRH